MENSIVVVEGQNYRKVVAGDKISRKSKKEFVFEENRITDQSQFFIASISKQFTAVLLLRVLSEKYDIETVKTKLHEPLGAFLKDTALLTKLQDFSKTP